MLLLWLRLRYCWCVGGCSSLVLLLLLLPSTVNGLNGNLAEQNRPYGSIRGIETRRSP
jgi:hypothetical protein